MTTEKCVFTIVDTELGAAALVGRPGGLLRVYLPGRARSALIAKIGATFPSAQPGEWGLKTAAKLLAGYFRTGRLGRVRVRLDTGGITGLRHEVYEELRKIPRGRTVTYAELARRIGRPGAHRSVGTALSRNPLPVFIPCHRVVRSDGGLGGFTSPLGTDLKAAMLRLEGAID